MLFYDNTFQIIVVFGDNIAVISTPIIPSFSGDVLFDIWVSTVFFSIFNVPTGFYYRYTVLVKGQKFTFKLQVICFLITGIAALSLFGAFYYTMHYRTKEYLSIAEQLAPWLADDDGLVKAAAIGGSVSSIFSELNGLLEPHKGFRNS